MRQKWFGCACCPPNIARLISSIGSYCFTEKENTLFVHQYIGATLNKNMGSEEIKLSIKSGFPWNGNVTINIESKENVQSTIALRIPNWCEKFQVSYSDTENDTNKKMVSENVNKVAVVRGPLVYCLEECDNGSGVSRVRLDAKNADFKVEDKTIQDVQMKALKCNGKREVASSESALYSTRERIYEEIELLFIPYYAWANRGENEMTVWVWA